MDAQLKKGVLELCLLQCLSGEPKYGYDIIQTMRGCFPDVTESTFYDQMSEDWRSLREILEKLGIR